MLVLLLAICLRTEAYQLFYTQPADFCKPDNYIGLHSVSVMVFFPYVRRCKKPLFSGRFGELLYLTMRREMMKAARTKE